MRVHDYIDYWAPRIPDAIYASDGDREITWAQMRSWSNRVGRWLASELDHGQRFGFLAKNSLEVLAVYFGASRAGAVPVPLNTRLAAPEWEFILADAGAELIVAEAALCPALDAARLKSLPRAYAIGGTPPGWKSFESHVGDQPDSPPDRTVVPDDALYQMYTSGTTGLPKGAVLSQRAVTDNIAQGQVALGVYRKTAMLVMPLFHAGAAMGAFFNAASANTSRIVRDWDAAAVIRILREERVAITTLVPAMIQFLLSEPSAADAPFPDLELILYGAAPIATEVLARALNVFDADFVQVYGMTELGACATALNPEDHLQALRSEPSLLLSAGRPVLGTQVRVVGADDSDLPPGQVGEVLVRGPQVMDGYWNRPEASDAALRGGWMHTGDAGYLDARGYLFICDRVKDMIVSGGENVYPREIEEALFKLAGVLDAAVIGIPDDRWGEIAKAYVVADGSAELTGDLVIAHSRTLLAGFKCPHSVEFVDELPRNATGKVDKRALREPYWRARERAVN